MLSGHSAVMSRATRISGAVLHEGGLRRWLFFVAIVNDAQSFAASRLRYGPFPRHPHNTTPRPDEGPVARNLALWEDLHLPATGWTFGHLLLAPAYWCPSAMQRVSFSHEEKGCSWAWRPALSSVSRTSRTIPFVDVSYRRFRTRGQRRPSTERDTIG